MDGLTKHARSIMHKALDETDCRHDDGRIRDGFKQRPELFLMAAIVHELHELNANLSDISEAIEGANGNLDDISETTADICRIMFDITGTSGKPGDKQQALRITGKLEDGHIWHHPQCDG